jgi:hypothetical protein
MIAAARSTGPGFSEAGLGDGAAPALAAIAHQVAVIALFGLSSPLALGEVPGKQCNQVPSKTLLDF